MFYIVFEVKTMMILNFVSLFLIMGIGADDAFICFDSYCGTAFNNLQENVLGNKVAQQCSSLHLQLLVVFSNAEKL